MSDQPTTPSNPPTMARSKYYWLKLRNDAYFIRVWIRTHWYPNLVRNLRKENADWKRWLYECENRKESSDE